MAVSNATLLAFRHNRLAGEEKKMNNSNFQQLQVVGHFRTVSTHYYCCYILGQLICLWLYEHLLHGEIIGAAILLLGHPTASL